MAKKKLGKRIGRCTWWIPEIHVHHFQWRMTTGRQDIGTLTYVYKCECGQWAIHRFGNASEPYFELVK